MKKPIIVPIQKVTWLSREDGFLPPEGSASSDLLPVIYKNSSYGYETSLQIRLGPNRGQIAFWAPISFKKPLTKGESLWEKLTDDQRQTLDKNSFIRGVETAFAVKGTKSKT